MSSATLNTPVSNDDAHDDAATPASEAVVTFADLGLRVELVDVLAGMGYTSPTPVQAQAIPNLIAGHDMLGQAATGTGKTAAFGLPLMQRLAETGRNKAPSALVLAPTRELAVQVADHLTRYGAQLGARVLAVYGGTPIGPQLRELQRGIDVVVATPGRAVDHINRGSLVLDDLETLVLDEADEMLDMGFAEDLELIFGATPPNRQTVLFSATMPRRIEALARTHLTRPVRLQVAREVVAEGEAPRVRQVAYPVQRGYRAQALGRVLDVEQPAAAIIFCRTREEVEEITTTLGARGHRAEALHGGVSQDMREKVMNRVRQGATRLLVATDVAARGLDVDHLTHVVNVGIPAAAESYVHRVGRVGRAGREGVAITLVDPHEVRKLGYIEKLVGQPVHVLTVPSVADLRTVRLVRTKDAVAEAMAAGKGADYAALLDELTDPAELREVALAALAVAHTALGGADDENEIPTPSRTSRPSTDRFERSDRPGGARGGRPERTRPGSRSAAVAPGMTRLFVSAGLAAGVRPADIVGAIANESRVSGKDIGAIDINDRFTLVDVPSASADDVINSLAGSTIKGRKAMVRREKF